MTSTIKTVGCFLVFSFTSSLLPAAASDPVQAVKRELNAEGQLFTYIDFEGGWKEVAQEVQAELKDTDLGKKDFVTLIEASGLSQIRAIGLSSTSLKSGYDNRLFIQTPGGRKGLLAIFPGEPAPFNGVRYAPADADLFLELRLDVPAVVEAVAQMTASVSESKEAVAASLELLRKNENGYGTLLDFRGTVVAVARLHSPEEIEKSKAEFSSKPEVDLFFQADSGADFVKTMLAKDGNWKKAEQGGRIQYSNTNSNVDAVVILDGSTVTAGMPAAFVEQCLSRKSGLSQSETFKQLISATAFKGQAFCYASPRIATELRDSFKINNSGGLRLGVLGLPLHLEALQRMLAAIPIPSTPTANAVVARPDGILLRSRSGQSLKGVMPALAMLTPDFIGQFITAAAKTYATSTAAERAAEIIHQKITGDLDRAHAAATKYFASHAEEGEVTLGVLREALPEEKIPEFADVQGEITFSRSSDQISFELKNGESLTHVFPLTPKQCKTIEATLKQIGEASAEYLLAGNSYVSVSRLVENGYLAKPESLVGEDYESVSCELEVPTLTIKTPGGQEVSYQRDPGFVVQARRRQAEREIAIEKNLALIHAIACKYLEENTDTSSVSYEQLGDKGLVGDIKSVAGEDYCGAFYSLTKDDARLSIDAPRAGTVTWVKPLDPALQACLTQKLTEIERAAAEYFRKNPQAEVVISGELVSQSTVEAKKEKPEETGKTDLTGLVIRRDYTSLKLKLENEQIIEVPRTMGK